MNSASIVAGILVAVMVIPAGAQQPRTGARSGEAPRPTIDDLVAAGLQRRGAQPAPLCSDPVFLRRVYLDAIGTLPTADEARSFLADQSPNKRAVLIDRLLDREEFADYWAMKWSDLLRVKSEFPINLWPNAVQAYHHWIRTSVRDNLPYDEFVRELLTGSGSNFRVPQVNFYRAVQSREPQAVAQAVALTFMGARAEHWPQERLAGMAVFFSQIGYKSTSEWKEEIVFSTAGTSQVATFPDRTTTRLTANQDPRDVFVRWLVAPGNPWFARSVVNRMWYWLLGHGIIHEADDIRADNPPANPELLSFLESELVTSHYNLKHVYRLILNSRTYQQSSDTSAALAGDEGDYARYGLRPLDAEVLIDALCQITGTSEQYSSAIPEPYTFMPQGQRAIALADGSISSSFLETFGRPSRDTGLESERSNRPTAAGRLALLNSSQMQRKFEQSTALQALLQGRDARQAVTGLYLTILSRFPTEDELQIVAGYSRPSAPAAAGGPPAPPAAGNRRAALLDLAWALINTTEFFYRH